MTTASQTKHSALGSDFDEKVLATFFALYKNARIFEPNNPTFINQCKHLYEMFKPTFDSGADFELKAYNNRHFINEKFVHIDHIKNPSAMDIVAEWQQLNIGGVRFSEGVNAQDIEQFFVFMSQVKPYSGDIDSIAREFHQKLRAPIELLEIPETEEDDDPESAEEQRKAFRQAARGMFFKSLTIVETIMAGAANDQEISLSKARRVVHSLIDHIMRDESSLMELAAIKNYDNYTYAHSTNVAVYSLTLGAHLGLDRPRLSRLGFSALFHDVGKVKLPKDLIRKPDAYDENDWHQMQMHPHLGAKTLLRNMKVDDFSARASRGAFEHHINSDFTGYPRLLFKQREPNLFSKIICVADTFDALTSGRIYIKKAMPPDQVLAKMRYQMTAKFDTLLLKIFNEIIGVWAAGSLVLLSSDEIALVLTNNDAQPHRPYVKIVGNKTGLLETSLWVDLSEEDPSERQIIRMIEPARYGLDVKDFILDNQNLI